MLKSSGTRGERGKKPKEIGEETLGAAAMVIQGERVKHAWWAPRNSLGRGDDAHVITPTALSPYAE